MYIWIKCTADIYSRLLLCRFAPYTRKWVHAPLIFFQVFLEIKYCPWNTMVFASKTKQWYIIAIKWLHCNYKPNMKGWNILASSWQFHWELLPMPTLWTKLSLTALVHWKMRETGHRQDVDAYDLWIYHRLQWREAGVPGAICIQSTSSTLSSSTPFI